MAKAKAQVPDLVETALKTMTPAQAMTYFSKLYAANGDVKSLKACVNVLKYLTDDTRVFCGTITSMLARMFIRQGEDKTGAFGKLRTQKIAPLYHGVVEAAARQLALPSKKVNSGEIRRVIIVTDQYLDPPHSPSVVALALAQLLGQLPNITCQILDTRKHGPGQDSMFHPQFNANVHQDDQGRAAHPHTRHYKGVDVPIDFTAQGGAGLDKLQDTLNKIRDFDPDVIIAIGDANIALDLAARSYPTVQWHNVQHQHLSSGHVQVYLAAEPPKQNIDWGKLGLHTPVHVPKNFHTDEIEDHTHSSHRRDLGIDDDDFVFAIVGNRLPAEMTFEFQRMLARILAHTPRGRVMTIGARTLTLAPELKQYLSQITMLPPTPHLRSTIAMADAFLNPPRQGGGGGAHRAVLEGVPVLTLKGCDVSVHNPDGAVDTLDELERLCIDIIDDEALWERQLTLQNESADAFARDNPPEHSAQRLLERCKLAQDLFVDLAQAKTEPQREIAR